MNREKLAGILVKFCIIVAIGCAAVLECSMRGLTVKEAALGLVTLGFLSAILSMLRFPETRWFMGKKRAIGGHSEVA